MTTSGLYYGLTLNQEMAKAIAAHCSGALSTLGSGWIIMEVVFDKKKLSVPYHRLLLGLSVMDIISSFFLAMSSMMVPEGLFWGARGNKATCIVQGVAMNLTLGTGMYNCSLALYYLLCIKYRWNQRRFVEKVERWIHPSIWMFNIVFAFVLVIRGYMNPLYGFCWIASWPIGCTIIPGYDCVRGPYSTEITLFFFALICVNLAFMTGAMFLVYHHVAKTESASSRYEFQRTRPASRRMAIVDQRETMAAAMAAASSPDDEKNVGATGTPGDKRLKRESTSGSSKRTMRSSLTLTTMSSNITQFSTTVLGSVRKMTLENARRGKTKEVATLSMLYVACVWVTWTPSTIFICYWRTVGFVPFPVLMCIDLFLPLQGFLNFFVYMRPRWISYAKRHPEWTLWQRVKAVMYRGLRGVLGYHTVNVADPDDGDHRLGSVLELSDDSEFYSFESGSITHGSLVVANHEEAMLQHEQTEQEEAAKKAKNKEVGDSDGVSVTEGETTDSCNTASASSRIIISVDVTEKRRDGSEDEGYAPDSFQEGEEDLESSTEHGPRPSTEVHEDAQKRSSLEAEAGYSSMSSLRWSDQVGNRTPGITPK